MIVFGVPVLDRYDLLGRLLMSVYRSNLQPDKIIIVDNGCRFREKNLRLSESCVLFEPECNLGVSGAWNTILDRARELGAERVVISNDDIELEDKRALGQVLAEDADIVRAPGYSLFAMKTSVVDRIGWFDEGFFPLYFSDLDHFHRLKFAGLSYRDPQGLGVRHIGSATLSSWSKQQQARFRQRFSELRAYYSEKWGGPPGFESLDPRPFGGRPPAAWSERSITRGGLRPQEPWRGPEARTEL